jgi:parallel beta-helix repeat protein
MGHDDPHLNWDSAVGTYGDKDRILITGILIEKNIVYENQGEGIGCYIVDRCIVRNNIVHDNFSVNLYSDDATNSVFECNYVYTSGNLDYFRNARPAVGIEVADEVPDNPSHSNVFRDNLVVGTTQPFRYGNYGVPVGLQDVRVYGNVFVALPGYTAVSIDRAAHHDTVFSENALVGGVPDNIPGILFRNNTVATSLPLDQPPPCLSKSARNDADPSHGHPHLTKLSVH